VITDALILPGNCGCFGNKRVRPTVHIPATSEMEVNAFNDVEDETK
jgi:hypothetical protein